MDSSKDKGSRSGSRSNLNESTMPLLEDDLQEKEKMELKEKASTKDGSEEEDNEKDDSKTEKQDGEDGSTIQQDGGETSGNGGTASTAADNAKGKKKTKKKKECHQRKPSCVNTFTVGLNLLDRDDKRNNDHVNIQFEDVICEPDSNHSFDAVWRLTFLVFTSTKFWCYRLLAALIALPCAIFCGFNFALLTCFNVWAVTPAMRILQIKFHFLKRIWSMVFRTIFDPIFQSIGMLFSNITVQHVQAQV